MRQRLPVNVFIPIKYNKQRNKMTEHALKQSDTAEKKRLSKRTWASIFIILLLIPVTIYVGWRLGDRKYYIVSLLIILYTMIPFFMVFEQRKPQARELVVIAVMCAIAAASRAAFIAVPFFKPIAAVIIITGVAFGAEAGFLTGAVGAFISNFIFGQGPWTPWQMFAYGIAGFLAGILFSKGIISKKPLPLAFFGAFTVLLIVGPILDSSTFFTMSSMIDTSSAKVIYLAGLPVNAVFATCTFLTLLLLSKPMFEKLDRIKVKYGMMDDEI